MAGALVAASPQREGQRVAHTSWGARLSLVILVLFSFALHMWRIDAKSIWWDESLSLLRARGNASHILSNRIDLPGSSTIDLHPPLYFLLLHGLTRSSGESDLVLRFPSVAFASLIVLLLYALGVRLRGPRAGLLAALFGALSPFYLWYAQEARMYTMVTALGLASVYFLWRACTEQKQSWGLAFGLAAAAAMATQYLFALLIVCEALLGYFLWPRQGAFDLQKGVVEPKRRRRAVLLWGIAILLLILLPLSYRVVGLALWPKAGRWYVPLGIMLRDALNSFSLGLSVDLREIWVLDVAFLLVYLIGVVSLWRKPPNITPGETASSTWRTRGAGFVVLVAYILLPILIMWLFSLFAPLYMGSRYVMMCSPALYLGLGVGLDAVAKWKRTVAGLLGVLLLAGMGFSTYRYFCDERYRTKEDYRSAALSLEANERVNDAIIVTAPENIIAFTHYYQGSLPVIPVPSISLSGGPDPVLVADELAALARSYDRLWLVHCRTMFSDPEELVTKWLDSHTLRLEQKVFSSYGSFVTLSAYLPRSPIRQDSTDGPRAAVLSEPMGSFEGRLRLLTYTLRYADLAGQMHQIPAQEALRSAAESPVLAWEAIPSGRVLSVVLLWQPLSKLGVYKTSLRLVDSQGTIWAQRDRLPFERLSTSEWPVDSQIRHEADLSIPPGTPPGVYRLQLWLYEEASGRSLSFRETISGRERAFVELGQIAVGAAKRSYSVREFVPRGAHSVGWATVFGGKLELLAFDLAPQSVKAGQTLELHLYWRARKAVSQDCELVINWEDAQGKVWRTTRHSLTGTEYAASGQALIHPANVGNQDLSSRQVLIHLTNIENQNLSTRWQAGEMLRGLLKLSLPDDAPPGRHKLHLLVFARDSQRFLWLRRGLIPYAGRDLEVAEVRVE